MIDEATKAAMSEALNAVADVKGALAQIFSDYDIWSKDDTVLFLEGAAIRIQDLADILKEES
jgi:hypothetical protein